MIVSASDFIGKYELHTGIYVQSKIQDYIDIFEKKYLINLLGAKLYDQFLSDLNQQFEPISKNFVKIYEPFQEDITFNEVIISTGMKQMLVGFIYFEYSKDLINQMTPSGNVQQKGENSNNVSTLNQQIYTRYNQAVLTYQAIQKYLMLNQDVLPSEILSANLTSDGENFTVNTEYDLIGGSGSGAKIKVLTVGPLNSILTYTISQKGSGYTPNDLLTVNGGIGAELEVLTVGVGDYTLFNGQYKGYAYWL
jgi:hypothetical protein